MTMAILPIRTYPDPVLRVKCPPVERFDEELQELAADMVATMHDAPGVGLAAPQVGVELRLAVVDLSVGKDPEQLLVLVNPEVVAAEGAETEQEGCLSIPELSERVERARSIRLRAHDLQGREIELEAEDWLARAVLHEIDHLDGVLFVDRLRGLRKDRARRHLRRLVQERAESREPAREEVPA